MGEPATGTDLSVYSMCLHWVLLWGHDCAGGWSFPHCCFLSLPLWPVTPSPIHLSVPSAPSALSSRGTSIESHVPSAPGGCWPAPGQRQFPLHHLFHFLPSACTCVFLHPCPGMSAPCLRPRPTQACMHMSLSEQHNGRDCCGLEKVVSPLSPQPPSSRIPRGMTRGSGMSAS